MKRYFAISTFLYFCCAFPSHGGEFDAKRHKMVEEVLIDVVANEGLTLSPSVMAAMEKVERHRFVPGWLAAFAYLNRPLPIGYGQTISQPAIVALMTELLKVKAGDNVLEIGTGSGYQAAVLAEIVKSVYSIEIIEPLEKQAVERLKSLGYRNVKVKLSDGYYGWPEAAPFDAIVVTAAPDHVPQPLVDQLAAGGRMVIPVGRRSSVQDLLVITKAADGRTVTRKTLLVRFVPLTRGK